MSESFTLVIMLNYVSQQFTSNAHLDHDGLFLGQRALTNVHQYL